MFYNSLTRREVLRAGMASASAYWFLPLATPANLRAQSAARTRGKARFTIFINLEGGQSHVDTWDLKEHGWTPESFAVRELEPGLKWPMGLHPKLASHRGRFTLVRSMEAREETHSRASHHLQTGRLPGADPVPAIGAVIAHEFAGQRRASDRLPAFVAANSRTSAGLLRAGFLPEAHAPLQIETPDLRGLAVPVQDTRSISRRWSLRNGDAARKAERQHHGHYESAADLLSDPAAASAFAVDASDHDRYGATSVGDGCIVARNLVQADQGTRFIWVNHGREPGRESGDRAWDHHANIYAPGGIFAKSRELDDALSALLDDLANTTRIDGTSLLDETLVVAMGEFGRAPGALNSMHGRDHHPQAFTGLFAGAGIQGGQVLGATDEMGLTITRSGWEQKRSVQMEDVACSIYSAMGIDWTKEVRTESGHSFRYVENAGEQATGAREVPQLFA